MAPAVSQVVTAHRCLANILHVYLLWCRLLPFLPQGYIPHFKYLCQTEPLHLLSEGLTSKPEPGDIVSPAEDRLAFPKVTSQQVTHHMHSCEDVGVDRSRCCTVVAE